MSRFSFTLTAALTGCSLSNLGMPSPGNDTPSDTGGHVDTAIDTGDSGIDSGDTGDTATDSGIDTAVEDTADSGDADSGIIDTGDTATDSGIDSGETGDSGIEACDVEPYCVGDVVYYCEAGELESFDCASASLECGTDAGYASCQEVQVFEVDVDGDGYAEDVDCDDSDDSVNPGATEVSDGIDNDCDGSVDENALSCENVEYSEPSSWSSSTIECVEYGGGLIVNAYQDADTYAFENGWSVGVRCISVGSWTYSGVSITASPVAWEAWSEADPVAWTASAGATESGGCDGYIIE